MFKITTLFASIVFTVILYQVSQILTGHLFHITILAIIFLAVFINYFALAFHRKANLSFYILVVLLYAVLHVVSYGQGGIRNSGIFYFSAIILIAYMLLGSRGGKVMAIISLLHVIYFYLISTYTSWTDYSLIGKDPYLIDIDFLITGIFSILTLAAQANYIEKSNTAVINEFHSKNGELADKNMQLLASQELLSIKNKEYERKNRELEQFAYVASHDLQEPLRTTTSFVKLLENDYSEKLDEKGKKYLRFITQSSVRMGVLIKDLLDYSRIGDKKELQEVDCNKILQETLEDLTVAINETNARISMEILPIVSGYRTELKQLFQNLVANAVKFSKANVEPEIHIAAKRIKNYWEFTFSDNGIGLEMEHSERIFIIFQRLHTRAEYQGSGIGLSHCKKIVELHNGQIWVQSVPGEGSKFHFTIPVK